MAGMPAAAWKSPMWVQRSADLLVWIAVHGQFLVELVTHPWGQWLQYLTGEVTPSSLFAVRHQQTCLDKFVEIAACQVMANIRHELPVGAVAQSTAHQREGNWLDAARRQAGVFDQMLRPVPHFAGQAVPTLYQQCLPMMGCQAEPDPGRRVAFRLPRTATDLSQHSIIVVFVAAEVFLDRHEL